MQRAQQPVGLKYGFLFKCSQTLKLWRTTWFVLGADELMYYKRGALTPKVISLKENPVSILAADVEDSKRAHSFKLATPSSRTLILAAESSDLVDEWIAAIRAVAALYGPPPEAAMNAAPTKKLTDDQKEMLQVTIDLAAATGKLIPEAAQSSTPGLYAKGILDSLSTSILMSATTARVVVYKPKVQSGFQRFTSSLLDAQAQIIKYKRVVTIAQKRNGKGKGKEVSKSLDAVTASLTTLINLLSKSITKWAADHLDPDLNKVEEEVKSGEEEEEAEEEPIEDKDAANSPYVSPFFVNPATSPPRCKKTWELMVEECNNLIKNMENLLNAKDTGLLKLPSPIIIDQAKQFMVLSQQYHQAPRVTASPSGEFKPALADDQFSLTKQQLLGSTSSIDYHAANIGLLSTDHVPPQTSDIISHAHSISTAISKLPSAIIKHRGKTLVTVIETIGSFSFSLSKLISDMVEHETFLRDPDRGRHTLHDEVHAVQYIALHMLALCPALLASDFRTPHDILHLTDSAKLLALGVTNTLESIRFQFTPSKRKRASPRKLASELTDAATGSMVFWFGLVGQEASMHLEA